VSQVGILPGSGRSLIDHAPGRCEVLITGDLSYHMGEQATERGFSLIDTPHGGLEWWAFKRWAEKLVPEFDAEGVALSLAKDWRSPWTVVQPAGCCASESGAADAGGKAHVADLAVSEASASPSRKDGGEVRLRLWIDGGSRGNPGPSAIGVVIEDESGAVLQNIARVIGVGTNNIAEYSALLAALRAAEQMGAKYVEVLSDSELLVRQMRGEYKVKSEGLRPLFEEARKKAAGFSGLAIMHVDRKLNARADALVNKALDEQQRAGL
jgi:ribonuclease HI